MTRRVHVHYLAVGGVTHAVLPLSLLLDREQTGHIQALRAHSSDGSHTPWLRVLCPAVCSLGGDFATPLYKRLLYFL